MVSVRVHTQNCEKKTEKDHDIIGLRVHSCESAVFVGETVWTNNGTVPVQLFFIVEVTLTQMVNVTSGRSERGTQTTRPHRRGEITDLLSPFVSLLLCENHSASALMDFSLLFQSCLLGAFLFANIL